MTESSEDDLVFFIDRSLGAHDVPMALRAAGLAVEVHDELFSQDTSDTEWLAAAGERGWVVLTKDSRIRRHPLELEALKGASVAAFMLTVADLSGAEMADAFLRALPAIKRLLRTRARPFVATIGNNGKVKLKIGGARRGGIKRD